MNAVSPVPVEQITAIADLRREARRWLAETEIPTVPLELEERFNVLRRWQRTLFDAGWMGLGWSRETGGRGLTARHQQVFSEELARAHAPAPIGLIGLDVVGPSIHRYGSSEQRSRFLPPLLAGEDIWCQGFSEPSAGSDLASLRTRALRHGDKYVVNGQKVWTSWGNQASWCALLCRTDPDAEPKHAGISYLIVDMSSPGTTVRPLVQMTGDAEFCEVFFDNVEVPVGNLVGKENDGWRIALDTLSQERGNYAMRRQVEIGWGVEKTIDGLRGTSPESTTNRRISTAIGESHVALRVLDAQIRRTVQRLIDEEGPHPLDSIDKLVLNDAEQVVGRALADLLGPFRLDTESQPLGLNAAQLIHDHYFSRAASIYGGTSQIQRNIVAERLLGLPRS